MVFNTLSDGIPGFRSQRGEVDNCQYLGHLYIFFPKTWGMYISVMSATLTKKNLKIIKQNPSTKWLIHIFFMGVHKDSTLINVKSPL